MNNLAVVKNETYYQASIRYITSDINDITKNFLRLGFHLHEVEQCEYFKEGGYNNVYDFALNEFNLSKSTVNRFIRICRSFSRNGNSYFLDEKYEDYSCSQLTEMLSMSPTDREKIKADMSVKEIREIKKNNLEVVATSQQDNNIITSGIHFEENSTEDNEYVPTINISKDNYDSIVNNYSKEYKYLENYMKHMITNGYKIEINFRKDESNEVYAEL